MAQRLASLLDEPPSEELVITLINGAPKEPRFEEWFNPAYPRTHFASMSPSS